MKRYTATVIVKGNTFTYEFWAWKTDEQSLFNSFYSSHANRSAFVKSLKFMDERIKYQPS